MAKGSQSQASSSGTGGGIPRATSSGAPLKGTSSVGPRRRQTSSTGRVSGSNSTFKGNNNNNSNMLRFYTDDAPGLKITPIVVLVMSVMFIGFVTILHVIGKFYSTQSKA